MTQPRPPRKTVLVLDDDKAVTSFVSAVLREAGYNVLVAFDPIQGYRLAQQAQPSLILLDLHMPAGGGMSVLDRVMASIRTQAIPVVIMSREPAAEKEAETRARRAVGYLEKPLTVTALTETVKQVIESLG